MKQTSKIFETITMFVVGLGVAIGLTEHAVAQEYYAGDNHGGDVHTPPEGSVINTELSANWNHPVAVDESANTYYVYVQSHWFDPQQIAQFPAEVMMYGIAPYDQAGGSE